ncbi:hypothetical protein HYU14_01955 [Candidatus Woesearchaeota archaeon]|nr:hypothetical protein [Candidatus Woesearchaeota archaeon]
MGGIYVPKQQFIEDLTEPQIEEIQKRMRPGGSFLSSGFIGPSQTLREVIKADAQALNQYGITYEQIADRLSFFMQWAFREESNSTGRLYCEGVPVDGKFMVFLHRSLGSIPCPFFYSLVRDEKDFGREYTCGAGSCSFEVKNEQDHSEISFPSLMPHLVRDHHFFEGDVPGRLNPEDAIKVLEIKPGVDYSLPKPKEKPSSEPGKKGNWISLLLKFLRAPHP